MCWVMEVAIADVEKRARVTVWRRSGGTAARGRLPRLASSPRGTAKPAAPPFVALDSSLHTSRASSKLTASTKDVSTTNRERQSSPQRCNRRLVTVRHAVEPLWLLVALYRQPRADQ